jgi:hypothetical protein
VHYTALTAFAFLFLSRRPRWSFVLLFVGFFLIVEVRLLLNLQFTTTAFIAGTAGLLLLVDGLQPDGAIRWPKVMAGLAFASVMFLIREPVAPLLAIVASPFLIERFGWAGWRRLVAAGLVCASLFVALHSLNRWYYQRDPEWAEYLQYNQLHGAIRTSPLKKSISQAAPSVGWSKNDAWMFANWYFSDPDVFGSASRMRLLVEKLKTIPRSQPFSWREFTVCLNLPRILGPDAGMLMKLAVLVALGCLFFAGAQRRRCFGTLLASYGLCVLLVFYLREAAHLPERVSYNLPLFIHVICLYWASGFEELPVIAFRPGASLGPLRTFLTAKPARLATLVWAPVCVVAFASLLLTWARGLSYENGSNCYLKAEISHKIFTLIQPLMPDGGKPFIIPVCFESPLEQCLVFSSSADKANFWLLPYGWLAHSPVFRQSLAQHRLRPFSLSLLDRSDVFFQVKPEWIERLRTYYREHYNTDIHFQLALNTDELPQYRDCQLHLYQAHAVQSTVGVRPIP